MAFGGFDRSGADAPAAEINMVPLIDVMLVLLVIFIVAAPMLTHSVPLQLPQASAGTTRPDPGSVAVSITAAGRVHWDGHEVNRPELQARLQQRASQQRDTELRLHADQAVAHGVVG